MSLFNMITGGGSGGAKMAMSQTTSTGTAVDSIYFDVDAEPTEWLLMCAGPINTTSSWSTMSTTYEYILNGSFDGADQSITTVLISSSAVTICKVSPYILEWEYTDSKLYMYLQTCRFMSYINQNNHVEYYLFYNTD